MQELYQSIDRNKILDLALRKGRLFFIGSKI